MSRSKPNLCAKGDQYETRNCHNASVLSKFYYNMHYSNMTILQNFTKLSQLFLSGLNPLLGTNPLISLIITSSI